MTDNIQQLVAQLQELKQRRENVMQTIGQLEGQLGQAVQFRTKIDGAIEWVESVYKRELDKKRKEDEEAAASQERLSQTP